MDGLFNSIPLNLASQNTFGVLSKRKPVCKYQSLHRKLRGRVTNSTFWLEQEP